MQQQLKDATAEAESAATRVEQLQSELREALDCNAELRDQLQRMAGTLAEQEAARDVIYEWPPSNQITLPPDHRQGLLSCSSSNGMLMDAAAQAALVQGLSEAFNKQAELQALLQQREPRRLQQQPHKRWTHCSSSCRQVMLSLSHKQAAA